MSSALLPQRRRALVLGTLVVLLHWLALNWLTSGTLGIALPARDGDSAVSMALLPALPSAAPAPEPVPPPKPQMVQPPLPDFAPLPTIAIAHDTVGEPAQPGPPAPATKPPVEPAPAPPQLAAAEAPSPPAPGEAPIVHTIRRYKVDVPPPADLTYDLARTDADGTKWTGQALLSWKPDQGGYQMRIEMGIKIVFARVNLLVLTSEGHLGNTGLAPVKMTEKRRGRSLTATHFDWPGNKVTFSASQNNYALLPGAQDKATVPLQLAAIARGDQSQLSGDIDMFVGEDRWGSVYTFNVVGPEEIDTPLGRLQTVRVARPPKQGSYKTRLDIWLSPAHGWLPVQIRSSEANGAVTTQTVNKIAMTQPGI
ncbi:DUF3108 domain-containing protein [Massilia sp. 9I]|uniref:DUF3108 domain-containing protein n=1 Tax=Massilia sp. 9I TaxID=2653152 RepID=UPI0012F1AA53|nr:DUF3108 domain-containing protein [Massilia sp. 9I]VXB62919.1 conserved hypothetical protein [Massilia sp. 9I]